MVTQPLWVDQLHADAVVTGSAHEYADQLYVGAVVKGTTYQYADQVHANAVLKAVTYQYIDQAHNDVVVNPPPRVSQQVGTALFVRPPRISQQVGTGLFVRPPRVSQIVVTALVWNVRIPDMLIYPDRSVLPGLGFNVKWTPKFYNAPTQTTSTGIDIDLAYSTVPTHDFELTYNFLRDAVGNISLGNSEKRILMGFFLACHGTSGRFLFDNPDDDFAVGEAIGTTDGTAAVYGPVKRTYGYGDNIGIEPVGQINTSAANKVYLDGVEQSSSTYSWVTTAPGSQYLKFTTTPASGKAITADFGFYYYCKFVENNYTFEKFMDKLWLLDSITIHSCKAGG